MGDIQSQVKKLTGELGSLAEKTEVLRRGWDKPAYYEEALKLNSSFKEIQPVVDELQDGLPETNSGGAIKEAENNYDPIGFELWEALAYDLALDHTDRDTIAEAYGLTTQQLDHLCGNTYFLKMLEAKKEEAKQLGSDAAFIVKMRMVANRATPQLLKRLTDGSTSNKDFHTLFKTAVELAQLTPQPDTQDSAPTAVIGASVTFNIQGVPGLEHLSPQNNNLGTSEAVEDAEFTEIKPLEGSEKTTEPELVEL